MGTGRGATGSAEAAMAAALAGDRAAFGELAERHRAELRIHCYRMLGSLDDAEDLVQETFLRAWRRRDSYRGRAPFRAWLYGIATNACLDAIERRGRRVRAEGAGDGSPAEVPWLQPYPDRLLEAAAPGGEEPETAVLGREAIELAFLVAIQHLPPAQRAVLLARDVIGWPARETAELLGTSVASVNSALQRARATMRRLMPERRLEPEAAADPSGEEREVLRRYMEASERQDMAALAGLMREDARFSMPPAPERYAGRDAVMACWVEGGLGSGAFGLRCLETRANGQPSVANYARRAGDPAYRAMALDVIRIEGGLIAEVVAFAPDVFPSFGLPRELPADG